MVQWFGGAMVQWFGGAMVRYFAVRHKGVIQIDDIKFDNIMRYNVV